MVTLTLFISCYRADKPYDKYQPKEALPLEVAVAGKYPIIEDATKVKEFIASIPSKAVLEHPLGPDKQKETPIIFYFSAPGKPDLIFVKASLFEEATPWLQAYKKVHPDDSDPVKIISVAGLKDWQDLLKVAVEIITEDAQVKELIESIRPDELLERPLVTDDKDEGAILTYVIKQQDQDLMFVPTYLLEEATSRLLSYYQDIHKVQMVAVKQDEDWKEIGAKMRLEVKNAEVNKERAKLVVDHARLSGSSAQESIEKFFKRPYSSQKWIRVCDKKTMLKAVNTIFPAKEQKYYGVNAAAKAINMVGRMSKEQYQMMFARDAPDSFGERFNKASRWTITGARVIGLAAIIGAALAGSVTFGASIAIPAAFLAAGLVPDITPNDLGPSPRQIAAYITTYLKETGQKNAAEYDSYNDFKECAKVIRDQLKAKKPVIAFWTITEKTAQYVNVVGVRVENDQSTEFVIMKEDGYLYHLNSANMKALMKRGFLSYAVVATSWKDYHLIRFQRAGKKRHFLSKLKFWERFR